MSNRKIFIMRSGQKYGPYNEGIAREMLGSGELLANDFAWTQGEAEWKSLGVLLGNPAVPPPPPTEPISIPIDDQQAAIDALSSPASGSESTSNNSSEKSRWTYVPGSVQEKGAQIGTESGDDSSEEKVLTEAEINKRRRNLPKWMGLLFCAAVTGVELGYIYAYATAKEGVVPDLNIYFKLVGLTFPGGLVIFMPKIGIKDGLNRILRKLLEKIFRRRVNINITQEKWEITQRLEYDWKLPYLLVSLLIILFFFLSYALFIG